MLNPTQVREVINQYLTLVVKNETMKDVADAAEDGEILWEIAETADALGFRVDDDDENAWAQVATMARVAVFTCNAMIGRTP